jgi:hypothetical protein
MTNDRDASKRLDHGESACRHEAKAGLAEAGLAEAGLAEARIAEASLA